MALLVYKSKQSTFISKEVREEIDTLRNVLRVSYKPTWEYKIGHLVPRDPSHRAYTDSSLREAGGISFTMGWWWMLEWPSINTPKFPSMRACDSRIVCSSFNASMSRAFSTSIMMQANAVQRLPARRWHRNGEGSGTARHGAAPWSTSWARSAATPARTSTWSSSGG